MQRPALHQRLAAIAAVLLPFVFAVAAFARVGGGESYSGGGSGGGSGDGGGGELLYLLFRLLFWLTFRYPLIGIPVDILVLVVVIRWMSSRSAGTVTITTASRIVPAAAPARLNELKRFDPNFSEITFADFCYSLYGRVHEARGRGDLDRYAPYLSAGARNELRARAKAGLREVRGVVIGSFRVESLQGLDAAVVTIRVFFESNFTEVFEGASSSWYVREQWTLERKRDILSPPPEKAKADHCPRCGAALQTRTDGSCEYCGAKITSGAFQWYVRSTALLSRESRGPLLTSNVPEAGTTRPTVYQARFAEARARFEASHPDHQWPAFEQRVRDVAITLQEAWTARDWERVRPLESEGLFQMHRYWIDAYTRQQLRNVVDGYRVTRVEPVKIDSDTFYEAITVRVWAEGRDHTVDESGRIVSGSATELRQWSEYWTFVRTRSGTGAGAQKLSCPNCGAPVETGVTGICPYCGGKLTAGAFDWILSRIEQDEAYGS